MSDHLNYQLELAGDTATLYLLGGLGYQHVASLFAACATIPSHIRTLRLDLHGIGQMSAEATGAVRLLLRHWRETRHGEFRLSTSHMLATLSDASNVGGVHAGDSRGRWSVAAANEALVGTYL
jgi:ABC-type transporter Mla MlaB component